MSSAPWRTPMTILTCGMAILLISFGLRQNLGLYMGVVSTDLGWDRQVFAFALAFQSLVWGVSTPFFGWVADRYGPAKVIAAGGMLYAAGLFVMSQASAPIDATLGIGVLTGLGMSMTGFPIVLSVVSRIAGPKRRTVYLGIASAGGSSGQLILVPVGQTFLSAYGWTTSLVIIAVMVALVVPLSAALAGGNRLGVDEPSNQRIGEALGEAGRHVGYKLLIAGYFVCGFQTMFIGAHLPAYLGDLGQPPWLAATGIALIGGFNIIGCIVWGNLGARYSMKKLLSVIYLARAVCMAVFMLAPIGPVSVILFTSVMGLLWLATVPLTTGIVARIFGAQFLATLVGLTFLGHQIGSFLGIWLGGIVYDAMGNYDPIFWGGVALGVVAAGLHMPIDDRPLPRTGGAAAALPAHG